MNVRLAASLATLLLATGAVASDESAYAPDGKLNFPSNYREWVFLSSGLDMNYSKLPDMSGHSMFDNVFADPASYHVFLKTGTWPEGAVLVKEARGASSKGSINQHGKFQSGGLMGVEVHTKDSKRFPGGWGFFAFGGTEPAQQIPTSAGCYTCHQQHGAVNTTFVQFYPTLLKIATDKKTLSPDYHP